MSSAKSTSRNSPPVLQFFQAISVFRILSVSSLVRCRLTVCLLCTFACHQSSSITLLHFGLASFRCAYGRERSDVRYLPTEFAREFLPATGCWSSPFFSICYKARCMVLLGQSNPGIVISRKMLPHQFQDSWRTCSHAHSPS